MPGGTWSVKVLSSPQSCWGAAERSPVTVLLNTVATPLAPLPVACVPEGPKGLWGALKDPESMAQALLEVALVHLAGAVPEEVTNGWPCLPEDVPSPQGCPPPDKGHLLTDAIATHAAFPPVALVTVKLILRALGHQADAKAAKCGWTGREVSTGANGLRHLSQPLHAQDCPCFRGAFADNEANLTGDQVPLLPKGPSGHPTPMHPERAFWP